MTDSQWQTQLTPVLRMLQIFVGTQVVGCVTFLGVGLALSGNALAEDGPPTFTYIGIAFAATVLVVRIIVPGLIVARGRRKIAPGTWRPPQQASALPQKRR